MTVKEQLQEIKIKIDLRDIKKTDLADKIGCTPQEISMWLKFKRSIPPKRLEQLKKALY